MHAVSYCWPTAPLVDVSAARHGKQESGVADAETVPYIFTEQGVQKDFPGEA